MTRLDLDPDLERLGDALRASAAVDLAREERAARSAAARRGRLSASARGRRTRLGPRALAGSSLGLAGVGAALALAQGGSAAPPAFGKTALAVTRQHDGSVLVKVNLNSNKPWVLPADRKLAAMGIDEEIAVAYQPGAARVKGAVSCTPLKGAATPPGPPVRVLFRMNGTQAGPSGNTGAGTVHVNSCVYYKSPRHRYTQAPPGHRYNGRRNTGNTGNG